MIGDSAPPKEGPPLIAVKEVKNVLFEPRLDVAMFAEAVHAALKDNVHGYALGLRRAGKTMTSQTWGRARATADTAAPWSLDTRVHVASVSKLLTSVIVTKMLDEHGHQINTAIGPFFPAYWRPGENFAALTFRELLTHNASFTAHGGDFGTFKAQIEAGVNPKAPSCRKSSQPGCRRGYTNGSFSLVRVLAATMTGAIPTNTLYEPGSAASEMSPELFNDHMWDIKSAEAFLAYAQEKVFTPSGVLNVSAVPTATGALAYANDKSTKGWDSEDVTGQLGGAGFRLSVNDVLDVMGTFRRSGKIVSQAKARAAIEARLGIDRVLDTPAGKLYEKNGLWREREFPSGGAEQAVAYYLPNDMELVVVVNSWIGPTNASLRETIANAYINSFRTSLSKRQPPIPNAIPKK